MTTTTLAAAGTLGLTAAGGYLFGPLGAGAGALVGSFLFGSGSGQKVEGPRLGDLSVAAASYGGVIPVGFGTQKVPARSSGRPTSARRSTPIRKAAPCSVAAPKWSSTAISRTLRSRSARGRRVR